MRKFFKNSWILGIGTTVIGGVLLSFLLDWINGVDWLCTLKAAIGFIIKAIISFLNYELKVWWLLIAVALIIVGLFVVAKVFDVKAKNEKPSFLTYTKDSVLGYSWEWEYTKEYDGKYRIINLRPVCEKCGMILRQSGAYGQQMKCLRCNEVLLWKDSLLDDAQMLIEDNIRKKYLQNQ